MPLQKLITKIYASITELCASSDDASIEPAVVALANICLSPFARNGTILNSSVQLLLGLFKRPREETHFTIGEALSVVASGWNSTASKDPLVEVRELPSVISSQEYGECKQSPNFPGRHKNRWRLSFVLSFSPTFSRTELKHAHPPPFGCCRWLNIPYHTHWWWAT